MDATDVTAIALAATGLAVLAGSFAGARLGYIHPAERRVFHVLNGLPDWLYGVLWVPMQFGNLVVGTAAGLVAAAAYRSWPMAISVVAAMAMKLVAERVVRSRLGRFSEIRQRPGTSQVGARLRGDVPASGASFPSGHVVLAGAIACVVSGHVPGAWVWLPFLLAVIVLVGRVYVGAHNPLDVTAGLGAGLLVGGLLLVAAR